MTKTDRVGATYELASTDDVLARYQRPGVHATVVMEFPTPGQVGDDRMVRWHVRRSELVDAGATTASLEQLDALVRGLEPRGETVLLSADDTDAAFCWLIDRTVDHLAHVGPCPALLAAYDELADRTPVVIAVVDHLGADLFRLDHLDLTEIGSVQGEEVEIDPQVRGDQAGYQRRVQVVYDRNADTMAREITEHAARAEARLVLLTGDDREVRAVTDRLDTHRFTVVGVQAGARRDLDLTARLRQTAIEQSLTDRQTRRDAAVARLHEELGRHALGVDGRDATAAAAAEGRVATIFVDRSAAPDDTDSLLRDTLLHSGNAVVADDLRVTDGVAAILRYAAR